MTVTFKEAELLPHEFVIVTLTGPLTAELPQVVVMEFVPWPAVIVTPPGTVHE